MKEIVATGTHEVKITLAGPNADFPVVLGTYHFLSPRPAPPISPKASAPARTSARSSRPACARSRVRNENYWKQGSGPCLDEIEFFGIPDVGARVNALLAGDVHFIGNVNPSSAKLILGSKGFSVLETKSGNYTDLVMRVRQRAGQQRRLRARHEASLQSRPDQAHHLPAAMRKSRNDQPVPPLNRYFLPRIFRSGSTTRRRRSSTSTRPACWARRSLSSCSPAATARSRWG